MQNTVQKEPKGQDIGIIIYVTLIGKQPGKDYVGIYRPANIITHRSLSSHTKDSGNERSNDIETENAIVCP